MAYIPETPRDQIALLPPSLDEFVAQDSIVRVIDAFVDGLDIKSCGFEKSAPAHTGRPAYDPRLLLKCYIYGYLNRIRSSRRLAKECTRNTEMMFLAGMLAPDFRTIADFRKDNAAALKNVFSRFVKVCTDLKLYDGGVVAVDGTKVRAQNSRANAYNKEVLDKKIANIEEKMGRYLESLDTADADGEDEEGVDPEKVRAALDELRNRKGTYEGYRQKLEDEGITQVLTTDPEARRMHTKDGFNCCYNIQAATDTSSHLIAGFTVSSSATDQGHLKSYADEARRLTGQPSVTAVADKGYESARDIKECLMSGIAPHVALKYNKRSRIFNLPYREASPSDELLGSTKPEDISTCLHAGVLPKCYENKGIDIEVQSREAMSCFIRNEDDTVTCPQGKALTLKRRRLEKNAAVFASKEACRECVNRCTDSANTKEVSFGAGVDCIPVMVYGSQTHPPQEIPENACISPYNHNLDRKLTKCKVVVSIPHDKERYALRMSTVEHPFGTIKWYDGAHYFLMRGIEKVTAEMSLSFLAYNLRRALNIVGFERLMAAVR